MTILTVSRTRTASSHLISPALTTGAASKETKASRIGAAAESLIQVAIQDLDVTLRSQRMAADLLTRLWVASISGQLRRPDDLALTPQVFPLPAGGLQLEWHAGEDHIEVAIEWDGTIGLYAKAGSDDREWELGASENLPFFVVDTLGRISDSVWAAGIRN